MSKMRLIDVLGDIRHYLMAGNPVWDTSVVDKAMTAAIEAVKLSERRGHWKIVKKGGMIRHECSECKHDYMGVHNYCPCCGAKMIREE